MIRRLPPALALAAAAALLASCAYYNTYYLAKKYYLRATNGQPYEVDREGATQRTNYSKSMDYAQKLIGSYPKSKWVDDAYLLWAKGLIGTDDPLKTVAMLEDFDTRYAKSDLKAEAGFFLGLAYREARKYPEAVEQFDEFLKATPRHPLAPYAYYERSEALMALQRYGDAAASAGEVLTRFPNSPVADRALLQRAEARFQQGDYTGARADFHTIGTTARTDQDRFAFLLREVDCLEAARDYDQALAVLRSERGHVAPPAAPPPGTNPAVTVTPPPGSDRYGQLTLRIGGVLLEAGKLQEALQEYQSVLQDYNRTQLAAEAQYRIGYAYETGADDFDRARLEYAKVKDQTAQSQFLQLAQQRMENLARISQFHAGGGADSLSRQAETGFLTAEHYLFELDRPERALEEYGKVVSGFPHTPAAGRALNAEAWVLSRKLHREGAADSLFWQVVRGYPATEAQLAARDYLEAAGISVPDSLIVAPAAPEPAPADTATLSPPPAATPGLGPRGRRGVFATRDSLGGALPGGPPAPYPALRDTLGHPLPPPAPPAVAPAPRDTARAPADTSRSRR